jgi:DNA processing protein
MIWGRVYSAPRVDLPAAGVGSTGLGGGGAITAREEASAMGDEHRREQAAVLALSRHASGPWWNVAQLVDEAGSALALIEHGADAVETPEVLEATLPESARGEAARELNTFEQIITATAVEGDQLVTVLDDAYPTNLRLVYDRPPFLFIRGQLPPATATALAVVGTRGASAEGLDQAQRLADGLARRGVVVISGLAKGIDAAAHEATLAAGGYTVAVMGTGLRRVYPSENSDLAARIVAAGGALVTQFFPDAPPRGFHFPIRNRTMSGLAVGTAVVEASRTSGARMQARIALEHGKRVFLVSGLVTRERWAQGMLRRPGVTEVSSVDEILAVVDELQRHGQKPSEQLTLA